MQLVPRSSCSIPDEFDFIQESLGFSRSRSAFHRVGRNCLHLERLDFFGRCALWKWTAPRFCQHAKEPSLRNFKSRSGARISLGGKQAIKVRFDVVNLFDKIYELRDGSGIGVGAPQFGQRRGFYGTVAYDF